MIMHRNRIRTTHTCESVRRDKRQVALEEQEDILCILQNGTREQFSVCMFSSNPSGASFVLSQEATLQPTGFCSFITCLDDEMCVRTPFATFFVIAANGMPSMSPSDGLEQNVHSNIMQGIPRVTLTCKFWSVAHHPTRPLKTGHENIAALLSTLQHCDTFQTCWALNSPTLTSESTLLLFKDSLCSDLVDIVAKEGLKHFIIPMTIFIRKDGHGNAHSLDFTNVSFQGEGAHLSIQLEANGEWPALKFVSERKPHRIHDIWVVCYVAQRVV